MTSIFPSSGNGVEVRDPVTGLPINPPNVDNVFVPPPGFQISCSYNALPNDCRSRVENRQVNAIVSEMIGLAAVFDPDGTWNCDEYDNLANMFLAWVASFSSQDIGAQICSVATSDGTEAAARLIYCANAVAYGLPIVGPDSLTELLQGEICNNAVIGLPNTVNDYLLYCRNGLFRKVSPNDIMLYTGEWVQARAYNIQNLTRKEARLWSPNANIPAGTAFAIGTSGATWYEVSPSVAPPYDPDVGYAKDTIISKDGKFYAANDTIPAGTPFVIGTTGATWREVDLTKTSILDHDAGTTYQKDNVIARNGLIYRALPLTIAPGAFNPAQWELIGGERQKFKGLWLLANAYAVDDMVRYTDDRLYTPNDAIPGGTAWAIGTTGATWREVSAAAGVGDAAVPNFDAATTYSPYELTVFGGQLYRAKATGHGPAPWNSANFDLLSSPSTWRGDWSGPGTVYSVGDFLSQPVGGYKGRPIWRCTAGHTSGASIDVTKFELIAETDNVPVWNSTRAYSVGDRVSRDGQEYLANGNIAGGTAFTIGYTGATWAPVEHVNLGGAITGTTYTLGAGDENAHRIANNASPKTVTIPTNVTWNCPQGTAVFLQSTGGRLTLAAAVGVTVQSVDNLLTLIDKANAGVCLLKTGPDTWWAFGNLG